MKDKIKIDPKKLKELLEFAHKSPEIVRLQRQCQEVGERKRSNISKKVVDDAFDALGIIIKNLSATPDEELRLQKFCAKHIFFSMANNFGAEITD